MPVRTTRLTRPRPGATPVAGHAGTAPTLAGVTALLQASGLRHSRRRDVVVEAFLASHGHVSVEELAARLRRAGIGHTTVYRALTLLAERGLATVRDFGDGQRRFEPVRRGAHHDHLVCDRCGRVEEFESEELEREQLAVARQHGFVLEGHTFELHGRCRRCRGDARTGKDSR